MCVYTWPGRCLAFSGFPASPQMKPAVPHIAAAPIPTTAEPACAPAADFISEKPASQRFATHHLQAPNPRRHDVYGQRVYPNTWPPAARPFISAFSPEATHRAGSWPATRASRSSATPESRPPRDDGAIRHPGSSGSMPRARLRSYSPPASPRARRPGIRDKPVTSEARTASPRAA